MKTQFLTAVIWAASFRADQVPSHLLQSISDLESNLDGLMRQIMPHETSGGRFDWDSFQTMERTSQYNTNGDNPQIHTSGDDAKWYKEEWEKCLMNPCLKRKFCYACCSNIKGSCVVMDKLGDRDIPCAFPTNNPVCLKSEAKVTWTEADAICAAACTPDVDCGPVGKNEGADEPLKWTLKDCSLMPWANHSTYEEAPTLYHYTGVHYDNPFRGHHREGLTKESGAPALQDRPHVHMPSEDRRVVGAYVLKPSGLERDSDMEPRQPQMVDESTGLDD